MSVGVDGFGNISVLVIFPANCISEGIRFFCFSSFCIVTKRLFMSKGIGFTGNQSHLVISTCCDIFVGIRSFDKIA